MSNLSGFFLGFFLSFLGQLPLGTMSITATQIALQENFRNAWKYAAGVALIELVYLRLVLSGIQWMVGHHLLFAIFSWISVIFFLVLGVLSFIAAQKQERKKKALLLNNRMNRFLLGISMSTLNPAQIPFWFVWTGYFISQGWLIPGFVHFNIFTIGAALGTMAGLLVYIYGGNWLVRKMNTSNRTLNKIMGIIFILAAIAQLFHIISY